MPQAPHEVLAKIVDSATQYQRGPAEPGQLAYGQATQANDAAATLPPPPSTQGAAAAPPAQAPAPEGAVAGDHGYAPATDAEKMLFAPTQRPDEPLTAPSQPTQLPENTASWLPYLQTAATSPNAPYTMRYLWQRAVEAVDAARNG